MSLQALFVLFVQTSVLLGVALVACAALRRSPAIRMFVCKAALVSTLAMAVASPWLRERQSPVVPLNTVPLFLQTTVTEPATAATVKQPAPVDVDPAEHMESHDIDPLAVGTSVYKWGVLLMMLGLGVGYAKLFRLRASTQPSTDRALTEAVDEVSGEFRVRPPAVRVGEKVSTVFVAGILRPTLFFPTNWSSSQNPETIHSVVRHEIAHVVARDLQWSLAYRLIHILLWPQFFLLVLKKPFCTASEELCDLRVLESGSEPKAYASALVTLREQLKVTRQRVPIGIGAVTIRSNFGRRIQHILGYEPGRVNRMTKNVVATGTTAAFLCTLIVASVFAASKSANSVSVSNIQANAAYKGSREVAIFVPGGAPFTGKAWAFYEQFNNKNHLATLDVSHGKVTIDLGLYPKIMRLTLIAHQANYGLSFKRIEPSEKPVTSLTLARATTLVGEVTGPDHKAVANAPVVVKLITSQGNGPSVHEFLVLPPAITERFESRTDLSGHFALPAMPQGNMVRVDFIDPKYAQYEDWTTRIETSKSSITDVKPIHLARAAEIRGVVTLSGKPVAGVKVGAQERIDGDGSTDHSYWADTVTDAAGRYNLGRLNAATYNVALDLDEKLSGQYTARAVERVRAVAGQAVLRINFELIPGGVVEGTVTGPDGHPVEMAQVGIYGPAHPQTSPWVQTMFTGPDGKYLFHVPPGKQYVYLMSESQSNHGSNITVADGERTNVNFQMK